MADTRRSYRQGLEALRDGSKASVAFLHNTGYDQSRGRGHTVLTDGVDSAILLRRMSENQGGGIEVQDEKNRDTPALEGMRLRFEPSGPLNLRTGKPWSGVVVRQSTDETLSNAMVHAQVRQAKVLAAIDERGGQITPGDLADALGTDTKHLTEVLAPFTGAGIVADNGKKTTARRYLRGPNAQFD